MGQNWFTSLLQPPFSPTDQELLEDKVWVYNYVTRKVAVTGSEQCSTKEPPDFSQLQAQFPDCSQGRHGNSDNQASNGKRAVPHKPMGIVITTSAIFDLVVRH